MKNTRAIERIISELAMKDYLAYNPRRSDGRPRYKTHRPYTLSPETNEARQVLISYTNNQITEKEYKAYCLRYNLTH